MNKKQLCYKKRHKCYDSDSYGT